VETCLELGSDAEERECADGEPEPLGHAATVDATANRVLAHARVEGGDGSPGFVGPALSLFKRGIKVRFVNCAEASVNTAEVVQPVRTTTAAPTTPTHQRARGGL